MELGHHVESYRFWDVVSLWGRETLQHEILVARVLARGVLRDGLRIQSVDPRWAASGTFELHGAPYVGFVARPGALPVIIRSAALKHLMAVSEEAVDPDPQLLFDEFITKQDFRVWLEQRELPLPTFWFSQGEREGTATSPSAARGQRGAV